MFQKQFNQYQQVPDKDTLRARTVCSMEADVCVSSAKRDKIRVKLIGLWFSNCNKSLSLGKSFGQDIKFQSEGFQPQMVHVSDDQSRTEQEKDSRKKSLNRTRAKCLIM